MENMLARMQKMHALAEEEAKDTVRAQVLNDALALEPVGVNQYGLAHDALTYLGDVAKHGCAGGTCSNLIYYIDTHAFYTKHADDIDELLEEYQDELGENPLVHLNLDGSDLRNALAWWSYEYAARKILDELGIEL